MPRRGALILACCLALLAAAAPARGEPPSSGRLWLYGNLTTQLHPEWSLTLMPGYRAELLRSQGDAAGSTLFELFVGPTWARSFGGFRLKTSLWYYYTGFFGSSYNDAHNLELIVTGEYRRGRWTFTSRNIFHNTFRASVYAPEDRLGYSLVLRNLLQAQLRLTPRVGLLLADEPFWGLAKAGGAAAHPAGFWAPGFRLNRVYAGVDLFPGGNVTLTPQYVYETSVSPEGSGTVNAHNHYLFVTVAWLLKVR